MAKEDFSRVTLTPAYVRDYKSKKEVIEALNAGKDFFAQGIGGSGYCSVRDMQDGMISVRYKKLSTLTLLKIVGGKVVDD